MREIKYRAWNKDNDEMVYSFDYPYHWNIGGLGLELLESDGTDHVRQEAVFMQYTGIKDKNDVEIYQDDIVHFKKQGLSGKGLVYWKENIGQWWIKDIREATKKRGQRYYPFYEDAIYRIDGNIHEHPHLLKEDN